MTLQEFIPYWQANPFQPFRIHTTRGSFEITHPLQIAVSPRLHVTVVDEACRASTFPTDEILRCEPTGTPAPIEQVLSALPPEKLARIANALAAASCETAPLQHGPSVPPMDPGTVECSACETPDGRFVVHATMRTGDGTSIFSTHGTRWNLHGMEAFENGTSLYLHHLDHPTIEQRIIVWPPDRGTFESFAEAQPLPRLARNLKSRDRRLASRPEQPVEPGDAYFDKIHIEYPAWELFDERALFGEEDATSDPIRYKLTLESASGGTPQDARNPKIIDTRLDIVLLDLTATLWHTTAPPGAAPDTLVLHHRIARGHTVTIHIDYERHTATVGDDPRSLPLAYIQRHLINAILHPSLEAMDHALHSDPTPHGAPDLTLPMAAGHRVEFWPGEERFLLPFLQPRVLDPHGRTLLDFRMTPWASMTRFGSSHTRATLRLISGERHGGGVMPFELGIDLRTHCVTSPGVEGFIPLGRLQALLRQIRTVPWMQEELTSLMARARLLPAPGIDPGPEPPASAVTSLEKQGAGGHS